MVTKFEICSLKSNFNENVIYENSNNISSKISKYILNIHTLLARAMSVNREMRYDDIHVHIIYVTKKMHRQHQG